MSHLINDPGRARRVQLLEVCAHHVARDGVVLVQRLPLGWMPAEERRTVGDVTVHMHDVELLPNGFRASNTYTVGDRSWTQAYESEWVDDTELDGCATIAGLRVDRVLDASAAGSSSAPRANPSNCWQGYAPMCGHNAAISWKP